MSKIIVSVEATADIREDVRQQYGIAVVPMEFIVDGKVQRTDDPDCMPLKTFYNEMREGKPTQTSQVNREEALSRLTRAADSGDACARENLRQLRLIAEAERLND